MNYPKDKQGEAVLLVDPILRIEALSEIYSKEGILIAMEKLAEHAKYSTNEDDIDLYNSVNHYLAKKLRERN